MRDLRKRFDRFCYRHRNWGIPNLMLYLCLGSGLVYLFSVTSQNVILYEILCFDRALILKGQVWRLFTYPLTYSGGNILFMLVGLLCYYSLGRAMENVWGTFRFNLFYLSGVVLMDVYCLVMGCWFDAYYNADVYYLNLSLFLAYATMYPDSQFLLFFIIPVKAWIFALLDLILVAVGVFLDPFPSNLFPLIALANYFLFIGADVKNVVPLSWRANFRRLLHRGKKPVKGKTIPFPNAGSYEASVTKPQAPYTHRCTVCGRTDVSNPELEFRYCSKCKGYYCYCQEHINSHTHIQ